MHVGVMRLTRQGQLDGTFGNGGRAEIGHQIALQPDGKVVVMVTAAFGNPPHLLVRFSGAAPDPTFGNGGWMPVAIEPEATYPTVTALSVQSDGKPVLVGYRSDVDSDYIAMRLLADGSGLDTSFGNGGRQIVAFDLGASSDIDVPRAVATTGGGTVIVGTVTAGDDEDVGVVLLTNELVFEDGFEACATIGASRTCQETWFW